MDWTGGVTLLWLNETALSVGLCDAVISLYKSHCID